MSDKPLQDTVVVQTSKVQLTMPNPDKWATFITRVFKGGGSIRLTVPVDTTELLGIKEGDYIEVMITKRKKQDSASLTGGFE